MIKIIIRFLPIFIAISFPAITQDLPLGALPMQFNSSFAGEAEMARLSTNGFYFNGKSVPSNIGFAYSYDQFIPAIRSGIGIAAGHSHDLKIVDESFYYAGLAIVPKFSINGKWTISPSIDIFYNKLQSGFRPFSEITSRVGLLLNTKKFYVGYSLYILNNSPVIAGDYFRYFGNSINNYNYGSKSLNDQGFNSQLQIGYTFQRSTESKFSVTTQLLFGFRDYAYRHDALRRVDQPIDLDKYIITFRHNKFLWGMSDTGPHVGWQTSKLRVMAFNNLQRYLRDRMNQLVMTNISARYIMN